MDQTQKQWTRTNAFRTSIGLINKGLTKSNPLVPNQCSSPTLYPLFLLHMASQIPHPTPNYIIEKETSEGFQEKKGKISSF